MPTDNAERRRRRCYQRVISGQMRGGELRFLMLSSSLDSPGGAAGLQYSWRKLYAIMKRQGWIDGYIKVTEYLDRFGLYHLHVIYRGKFIPQVWLSRVWSRIHKAHRVDIQLVKMPGSRMARYLVKYMVKDSCRYSWSWRWVFPGFVGVWDRAKWMVRQIVPGALVGVWMKHLVSVWDDFLGWDKCSRWTAEHDFLPGLWNELEGWFPARVALWHKVYREPVRCWLYERLAEVDKC